MSELPAMAVTFAIAAAIAFLFGALITLFRQEDPDLRDDKPVPLVFGPATETLAGMLPSTADGREEMRKTLIRAGHFEPVALTNFMALRSLLMYPPLVLGVIGGLMFDGPIGAIFVITGFICAALGFALPRLILNIQANARTEEIRRGLPTFMDILGLTLSTGAALPAAMLAAAHSVRRGYPALAHEFRVVVAQAPLHSVSYALDQLRLRQPIPELGSLVFLLSQGDRLGTDITKGLWELSTSLQVTARQRAEAAANRSNFYMLFPTVLCLLLAAGLAIIGPGVVQLIDSNREVDRILDQAKEQEKKLRDEVEQNARKGGNRPQPKAQPPRPEL